LANFFVLSIFGNFYYALETRLLKSENRFHTQHLPPRAVEKLNDDHVATIYEAYQVDIYLALEDFRREVARRIKHNFNVFDRQVFLKIVQNLPFVS
jgi:hypothetical protein